MMTGRPTDYSEELADIIFSRIISGESVNTICKDDDMPDKSTFFRWLRKHKDFRDNYELAAAERSDALVEDMLDIADNQASQPVLVDGVPLEIDGHIVQTTDSAAVAHARLRVDTRKWAASKLKPKKYGEKLTTENTVTHKYADMTDEELAQRRRELEQQLKQSKEA